MSARKRAVALYFILLTGLIYADITGFRKVAALRVSFKSDSNPGTTGTGQFMIDADYDTCGNYTIDPPPHNRVYFEAQLKAMNNYFRSVSKDQFGIDLDNSDLYPAGLNASYELPDSMAYYHGYGDEDNHELRLVELFKDAVELAYSIDQIDFSDYDVVIVYHAGIGQDFELPYLDPTPEDIPSTYVDPNMIAEHLGSSGITVGGHIIDRGIILPETQNHLLYSISEDIFYGASEPCDYQYGLTGTAVMLFGFANGFPPLWNIETGQTGVGIFGLMDQGSNNGRGLIPAPPVAWARYYAGWEEPEVAAPGDEIDVIRRENGNQVKLDLNQSEYFLIENRNNWLRPEVSIDSIRWAMYKAEEEADIDNPRYPPFVEILFDSVAIGFDSIGVVTEIPNYDLGLPGSGLLIWHIDEDVINAGIADFTVNANREHRGVDLEEADGAQDIGQINVFTFTDPTSGYFGDIWYQGNPEYENLYRNVTGLPLVFGPHTYPDTRSNSGAASHLIIEDIGFPGDTMTISIHSDLIVTGFPDTTLNLRLSVDIDDDGHPELIGGSDSIWWSVDTPVNPVPFTSVSSEDYDIFITAGVAVSKSIVIAETIADSVLIRVFEYDANSENLLLSWYHSIYVSGDWIIYGSQTVNEVTVMNSGGVLMTLDAAGVSSGILNPEPELNQVSVSYTAPNSNEDYSVWWTETESAADIISVSPTAYREHPSIYKIALADLDLDGKADIVVADNNGSLTAYTQDLYQMNGFPVNMSVTGNLLIRNLFGTEHPEIVTQNEEGEVIILDWQGNLQYRLANSGDNRLQQVGDYLGRSAIFSYSTIWHFDSLQVTDGNEWSGPAGNLYKDQNFILSSPGQPVSVSGLLEADKSYCYPNPGYGDMIRIRSFIGNAETLTITIFDIAGYQVKKIEVDDLNQQSVFEYEWDISDYDSGLYFCRLVAENAGKSKTVILKASVIH